MNKFAILHYQLRCAMERERPGPEVKRAANFVLLALDACAHNKDTWMIGPLAKYADDLERAMRIERAT